jgi:hypothetical protein
MGFANEASKILTNKYFLYFIVFLAGTNMLGYLVTNRLKAFVFFILVSILTYQFSKNMAVVLLVAMLATNFLITNNRMREGLETQDSKALENIEDKDKDIADAIPAVKKADNVSNVVTNIKEKVDDVPSKVVDANNVDLNTSNEDGPTGAGQSLSNKKVNNSGKIGPRLDYAATIEESYKNLDQLLGSESIQQLTTDTQKLMKQQQTLFDTMQNMVPVLQGAQSLLKDFKIDGLTDSLKGISGLANVPIPSNMNK